ncbi:MAG TPA: glycosyltransferase [Gemmatimonadaceae bacterium]
MILLVIAAVAFGVVLLAWAAYPLVMWLRARATTPGIEGALTQRVAVIIATRDSPDAARTRVSNVWTADYPRSLLNVIVAVDQASPFPLDAYRDALGDSAIVVAGDRPGGKAANLNAGARTAAQFDTEVLVFADVGQEFSTGAIRHMVRALQDDAFGGVAGRYTQHRSDSVMAAYARLEAVIRAGQARSHSVVSTSGSIYAIRGALWRDLPVGLICDDLYTTLSIVRQGKRVGFCHEAVAFDPRTFSRDEQFVRRVRTLTGLIQYFTLEPWALRPWSNPIWIHLVMHKVLRLLTPIPLAIGTIALLSWIVLKAPLVLLVGFGVVLLVAITLALLAPRLLRRAVDQLAWVLRLQLVPGLAIMNGLKRRWTVWTPTPQGSNRAGAGAGA